MQLSEKVTLTLSGVLALFVGLNYGVFHVAVFRTFERLEKVQATRNAERCAAAIRQEVNYLTRTTIDWAQWDDTYQFVEDRNKEYEESNLGPQTFIDCRVSLIAIYNARNHRIWGQAYDLKEEKFLSLWVFVADVLPENHPLVKDLGARRVMSGLMLTDKGILLVASSPILTSKEKGPARGRMIMGRFLDDEEVRLLSERLQFDIKLHSVQNNKLPAELAGVLQKVPSAGEYVVYTEDRKTVRVFSIMDDLWGQPAVLVETWQPREIYAVGQMAKYYTSFAIALVGLFILFSILVLLRRLVVAPVGTLTENVLMAKKVGSVLAPFDLHRADELGTLSREFDVTIREWSAAKEKAEQANRAKTDFLSTISHELRTPLNGIIGLAELMLSTRSHEKQHDRVRMIISESESLIILINELLDTARIEAGKLNIEEVPFDLSGLVEEIISVMSVRARQKGLTLSHEVEADIPHHFIGDPHRIKQVLVNLVGNALKFTDQGFVKVLIRLKEKMDDHVILHFDVTDTGIGIPKEKQGLVFNRFVQVESSTARQYGGTGLGTSIARLLANLMGGEIGVEGAEGKGSTFWFDLPLRLDRRPESAAAGDTHAEDQETISQAPVPGHILVVEDYETNQQVAISHLQSVGHTVELAANGEDALKAVREKKYDLILMDIQLPGLNGYQITREIRSGSTLNTQVPILAMTAHVSDDSKQKCREVGMNDVVGKPLRRKVFLAVVDQWLQPGRSSPTAERRAVAEEVAPPKNDEPIDLKRAVREFADNAEMVHRMTAIFLENVEQQIVKIRQAVKNGETEVLWREAHAIKGGAANLAAQPLSEAASRLEKEAHGNATIDFTSLVDMLEKEFRRLKDFVGEKR